MFSTTKDARSLKQAAISHPSHRSRSIGSSHFFFQKQDPSWQREDNGIEIFAPHMVGVRRVRSPGIEKLLQGFAPKRLIQPHRCVEAAANVEEVAVFAVPRRVLGAG